MTTHNYMQGDSMYGLDTKYIIQPSLLTIQEPLLEI